MSAKSIALLALSLGCGLIAAVGITRGVGTHQVAETQHVVVALNDLSPGTTLSADVLRLASWPKDQAPLGALSCIEDAEGRHPRGPLCAGEPILDKKLLRKGEGPNIPVPRGYRLVSVRVDPVSTHGGLLSPRSRVDFQVHIPRNPAQNIDQPTTQTVLQDIEVYAVDNVVNSDLKGQEAKPIQAKTVSLLVTPPQADIVTQYSELGTVRLVMRGLGDDQKTVLDKVVGPWPGVRASSKPSGEVSTAARPPVMVARENAFWVLRMVSGLQIRDFLIEEDSEQVIGTDMRWNVREVSNSSSAYRADQDAPKARQPAKGPEPRSGELGPNTEKSPHSDGGRPSNAAAIRT
jgi:pilus assembly protein CpaB